MSGRKSLKGIHVAVDAYNLELAHGTGIKTYGITLLKALRDLEASVAILSGRPARRAKGSVFLKEILFHDTHGYRPRASRLSSSFFRARAMLAALRTSFGVACQAIQYDRSRYVILGSEEKYYEECNLISLRNCYELGFAVERLIGKGITIAAPERIDIWHATYPLPVTIKGAKKITTVHDLVPFRLPYTTLDDKVRLFKRHHRAIRESELVLTVSEASKRDILELFGTHPDKVCVTYQPVSLSVLDEGEERSLEQSLKQRFHLQPKNYFLFVGAIEPKKNVKRLIDAFGDLDTDMALVIAGKRGWLWEQEVAHIERLFGKKSERKVRCLDYVSKDDLRRLYAGAYCFVFPSLYEGFGLPAVEAMTFGVPVITSDVSALPEVCGDAALYVDPYDTGSITARMEQVMGNADVWNTLSEAGKARVQMFSMENYTKRLADAYAKIL